MLVLGGEQLSGVHPCPSSNTEMRENIERIIHYMTSNRIRMHHTNPKGIVLSCDTEGSIVPYIHMLFQLIVVAIFYIYQPRYHIGLQYTITHL
jgi:hypothetical protein